jgi:hypothetical protein
MTNSYVILVGKTEGMRQSERPKRRWEDGIERILRNSVRKNGLDFQLVQNRIQGGSCEDGSDPSGSINLGEYFTR